MPDSITERATATPGGLRHLQLLLTLAGFALLVPGVILPVYSLIITTRVEAQLFPSPVDVTIYEVHRSILGAALDLWRSGDFLVAFLILFFSVAVPGAQEFGTGCFAVCVQREAPVGAGSYRRPDRQMVDGRCLRGRAVSGLSGHSRSGPGQLVQGSGPLPAGRGWLDLAPDILTGPRVLLLSCVLPVFNPVDPGAGIAAPVARRRLHASGEIAVCTAWG